MISLTNHDFQWGRSEVVIIYPDIWSFLHILPSTNSGTDVLIDVLQSLISVSQFPSINAASTIDFSWDLNGFFTGDIFMGYTTNTIFFCVCVCLKNRGLNNDIRPSYGYVDNKNWYKPDFGVPNLIKRLTNPVMKLQYIYIYIRIYTYTVR